MEDKYVRDDAGKIYKVNPDGSETEVTDLSKFRIEDIPEPKERDYGPVPINRSFDKPGLEWLQAVVNIPSSAGNLVARAGKGAADLVNYIRLLSTHEAELPKPGPPMEITPQGQVKNNFLNAANRAVSSLAEPYKPENIRDTFTKDPMQFIGDVASVADIGLLGLKGLGISPKFMRGTEVLPKILRTNPKETAKLKLLDTYAGRLGPGMPEFNIANLGTPSVNVMDVVNDFKNRGGGFTVGQLGGDIGALKTEQSEMLKGGELTQQMNRNEQILQDKANELITQAESSASNKLPAKSLETDPAKAAADMRTRAIQETIKTQKKLNDARDTALNNVYSDVSDILPGKTKKEKMGYLLGNIETYLKQASNRNVAAYRQAQEDLANFKNMLSRNESKTLLTSEELTYGGPKAFGSTSEKNPETIWNIIGQKDLNDLSAIAEIPGMAEHIPSAIVYDMFKRSRTSEGYIDAKSMINYLSKNAEKFKNYVPPDIRAGLTQLAYAAQNQSKHRDLQYALSLDSQKDSASVMLAAGIVGNLKGRFTMGATKLAEIYLKKEQLAKILADPEGVWIMSRLAGTPVTSPSLQSNVIKLGKVMGRLNIPARFKGADGEEIQLGEKN